jgi:hypothetical protein
MKIKFKGTKGKWELSDDKRNICVLIKPQTYKTICSNFYNTKWEYDAKLISNAPILFEALQDGRLFIDDCTRSENPLLVKTDRRHL